MQNLKKLFGIAVISIILASCGNKAIVVYNRSLEEVAEQAREEGRDYFFVVMSKSDCPPCTEYTNNLHHKRNRHIFGKSIINIVDLSQSDNLWYSHWLCSSAFPTTCIFSADGKLEAIISGGSGVAMKCIESSITGKTECANDLYQKHYPVAGGHHIAILNELLACKRGLDKGEDMGELLDNILGKTNYPYPTYLKALNEDMHGRRDEAIYYAEEVLAYDNLYYYYVYDDIYRKTKYIINPDYTPQDDGMLVMAEEILLDDCKVGEPRGVAIHVENAGKFPTFIRDIQTSCTCVELLGPKQYRLNPGESVDIEVEFKGEAKGEVYREVMFFSNSSEPLKRVALRAKVV